MEQQVRGVVTVFWFWMLVMAIGVAVWEQGFRDRSPVLAFVGSMIGVFGLVSAVLAVAS